MSKASHAAKSVIVLIIFSLGSKVLGFIREVLIAAKFGSGMETDTFFVALTATSLITTLVGNSINTTIIPILSEIESKEGKEGKIKHSNNILNILFIISLIVKPSVSECLTKRTLIFLTIIHPSTIHMEVLQILNKNH